MIAENEANPLGLEILDGFVEEGGEGGKRTQQEEVQEKSRIWDVHEVTSREKGEEKRLQCLLNCGEGRFFAVVEKKEKRFVLVLGCE